MYEPTENTIKLGESVLIHDPTSPTGYLVGRYTGTSHPDSESFEIRIEDPYTGETNREVFHKEDIYKKHKTKRNNAQKPIP